MEHLHATQWADRLAGERANETALTVGQDLSEAREQIERLTSQLNFTRIVGYLFIFILSYLAT